jgi:hypothetical protein
VASQREFLVEVYGPLFAAIGRLALPAPVRLSDFVNEREGFLRLTDVLTHGDITKTPRWADERVPHQQNRDRADLQTGG